MPSIELPSVVFSKPRFVAPVLGLNNSSSGYWSSSGVSSGVGGVTFDQTSLMDGATSGTRSDLLDPSTSNYVSARNSQFNSPQGFSIYSFGVKQDNPITLPRAAPVSVGEIRIRMVVTARSASGQNSLWAFLEDGEVAYDIPTTVSLQDPNIPTTTSTWQSYSFNMTYDLAGYDFFPITNALMPAFWDQFCDAFEAGDMRFSFSGIGLGDLDIAHVKFEGEITYLGSAIDPGTLTTRQRFGRA